MQKKKISLCVVAGLQCSGKTSFLLTAKKQDCVTLEWSEVIYDDLGSLGAGDKTQWFRYIGHRVKEKGPTYYPNLIFHRLMAQAGEIHVVSGARNPVELEVLLGMYSKTSVIWIESDATKRFLRSKIRARHDMHNTFIDFIQYDHEELRGGLAKIAAKYVTKYIINNASNKKFESNIIALLESLKDRRNCNARI